MKPLLYGALLGMLLSPGALAQKACHEQAQTELETLYCQVRVAGTGASLPRFHEFRANSPSVQASLLRGPARRAGLSVPSIESTPVGVPATTPSSPSAPPQPAAPAQPSSPSVAVGSGGSFADAVASLDSSPPPPPVEARTEEPLADCRLLGEQIRCSEQRFVLRRNQPNSELNDGVLQQHNRLGLSPYGGDLDDEPAVRRYLSHSYRRYIQKMMDIGLGASTMSYTKFYHTFWQLQDQGQDFAERFDTMFQYLQQDKASLAVQPQYTDELPASLQVCMFLTPQLIVCDNRQLNWVYSLAP